MEPHAQKRRRGLDQEVEPLNASSSASTVATCSPNVLAALSLLAEKAQAVPVEEKTAAECRQLAGHLQVLARQIDLAAQQKLTDGERRLVCYDVGELLGSGTYATVHKVVHKATGQAFALKSIRHDCREKGAAETAHAELKVLRALKAHRHVVSLTDHFETSVMSALVLELATGGEVFARLAHKGPFSEASAAKVVAQVASALEFLHGSYVVHSDIKPDNLLYVSSAPDADVKLADFGLSEFCGGPHRKYVLGLQGSLEYSAPEAVQARRYAHQADVWALGVVLFVLLGGYFPFNPQGKLGPLAVRDRILRGVAAFSREEGGFPDRWSHVSAEARRIICRMLDRDSSTRATATQLLSEPWLVGAAPQAVLPDSDHQLKRFNDARRVWRMAADAVALVARSPKLSAAVFSTSPEMHRLSAGAPAPARALPRAADSAKQELTADAYNELRVTFRAFDEDGSGEIELGELRHAMRALGASDADAEATLRGLDTDRGGSISFDEFATAVAPLYRACTSALRGAFDFFDADGSGFIEKGELEAVLTRLGVASTGGKMAAETLDTIFAAVDHNRDGRVSFEEFVTIFTLDPISRLATTERGVS